MTRQEAKDKLCNLRKEEEYSLYYLTHQLLDEIYDDFEEQLSSNSLQLNCEGCKWYEVRNHNASCDWCEKHPSRQIKNINIKDYWESKK